MDRNNRSAHGRILPRALVTGLAWLLASCLAGRAQAPQAETSPGDRVDKIFAQFSKLDSPGCAVAVIRDGSIIFKRGYGMADLDRGTAITPTTVFHAASLAKQFTAMSIMLLVQQGKLSLDDDVTKHVPELKVGKPIITIGDMLRHISGIRDQWVLVTMAGWRLYDDLVTRDDILGLVERMNSLDFDPRTDFIYSNTGYTLAGLIVERVSGRSLADFARDNIFQPLGMKDTVITATHGQIVPNRAYGYRQPDGQPFELFMPNLDVTGPTNLLTTVEDLARWDRNFDDKTVGGDFVLSKMIDGSHAQMAPDVGYGLGLQITKYHGLNVIEHDGRDAGYRSHLIRFPDQHFAVACLCNQALPEDNLPRRLVREVADVYLADRFAEVPRRAALTGVDDAPEVTSGTADLAEYAGRYYSKEIDTTYTIEVQDRSLMMKRYKYPTARLTRRTDDLYTIRDFSRPLATAVVRFTRQQSDQKIDGFLMSGKNIAHIERLRDSRFTKIP
jgi:CubicO group peptidase (beta-lactamase class C family)